MKDCKIKDFLLNDYQYIRSTWLTFSEYFGYDIIPDYLNIIHQIAEISNRTQYYPQLLFPAEIYSVIRQPFSIKNKKNTICPKKLKKLAKKLGE